MPDTTNYLSNILGQNQEAMFALRELPPFREASSALLELVFRYGKVAVLRAGEELTHEGEFDQWVYFIIKGRLGVYVGDQHVDTIAGSLVGERCILGEHRRATLRAAEEGVTAMGVDMALLDALRDNPGATREPVAVYIELLSIIAGEVVNRIVELEFNLLDFSYKYVAHNRTEQVSDIVRELSTNAYSTDRKANFSVYRYLNRHDPVALSKFCQPDGFTVDTARLYADALLAGEHERIYHLAEAVLDDRLLARGAQAPDGNGGTPEAAPNYARFVAHFAGLIARQQAARSWGPAALQSLDAGVRRRMALNELLKVDLRGLIEWLVAEFRFTAEDTIDLLMATVKEACEYNALINGRLKSMVSELTRTRFAKELGSAALARARGDESFLKDTPVEELIPYFSQNILEVYLVHPYALRMQELRSASAGHVRGAGRDELLTSLFK